jgi:hypothetical protein
MLETLLKPLTGRESQRRNLKVQLARAKLVERDRAELNAKIQRCNGRIDTAVSQHQADCAPVQRELSEIAARQAAEMADRAAPDGATECRRIELLGLIDVCNQTLDTSCRSIRDEIARHEDELAKMRQVSSDPVNVVESKLIRLASDETLANLHYATETVQWLNLRIRSAQEKYEDAQGRLSQPEKYDSGTVTTFKARAAKWRAELDRLGPELAAAVSAVDEITQRAIEE